MNWDKIREEYESTDITLKALADKHDIKLGTLKSRKSREKWERDATEQKDATNRARDATTKQKGAAKKKNRSGNPNPKNQFGERNTAALKHGIFSKYLPKETLDIIGMMGDKKPADLLFDQIQIQYATIIRSQQIMWVQDKDDMAKEQVQFGFGDNGADKYEVQFAWDRQATFIASMTRAMGTLGNLIKQFNNIAHDEDERKLKLEQMQITVEKTKLEIERIGGEGDADLVDDWVAAMGEVHE